jgi:hypothetical protein
MDFLLRPEIAARNARATGLTSGDDAGSEDVMKRLFPTGAVDASLAPILDKEWARVRGEGSASGEAKKQPAPATAPKPHPKAAPRHTR